MQLAYIWAEASKHVIGKDGTLPWHLPADLAYFKRVTANHPIIMGRKTFASLPHILPHRHHVVLTHDRTLAAKYADDARVTVVASIAALLEWCDQQPAGQVGFVIGGASLFALLSDHVKWLYQTKIKHAFPGDVTMPALDWTKFECVSHTPGKCDDRNQYPHEFFVYRRK